MSDPTAETRILVPTGALGGGVEEEEVAAGLALLPHAIALDAGSTDSGPAALATGRSKYSRRAVKHDLAILMRAQAEAGVPLLIGSCGTSGSDAAVDWTLDIVLEITREHGLRPRIAAVYAEQDRADLHRRNAAGTIRPLPPAGPLTGDVIDACDHVVALLGAEPYMAALRAGADIVLGGRTTDTALIAAVPLMRGAAAGAAWHAGKIAECGGLCTVEPMRPGVMVTVDATGFSVFPLSPLNRCTPETVSAHMLYENGDPFLLREPGGTLDVRQASYRAVDARVVRVEGSRFAPAPYTNKLEGAGSGPFQTIMIVGIEDPHVLEDVGAFVERMEGALRQRLTRNLGGDAAPVRLSLRAYGWNGVSGRPRHAHSRPLEVGLMLVVTAPTQALATEAAKVCNPLFFHLPAHDGSPMPTYAFPFSPAEIERGQVFEFHLNHVAEVADPCELARTRWVEVEDAQSAEETHA